ncbi:MAG: protein kinase [Candidatus Krumholzibacteriota bacterium]
MIGQTISHYRILAKIGEGGMGVIYKAEDLRLDRIVALKFMPPSKSYEPVAKARFVQEAKAASALDHPNICTIYEIDESRDGEIFIAMAFYEGKNLEQVMAEGNLKLDDALDIISQLASGLALAHRQGIVHQDINPRNIIVLEDGQVKLIDFGVAKLSGKSHVITQDSTMGTMAYMAPEQLQAQRVDLTTDVWALGTLLYELICGRKAFPGDHPQAVMYEVVNVDPEPIPGLPAPVGELLGKAMEKNSRLRHADAGEFLEDLSRWFPGKPGSGKGGEDHQREKPGWFLSRRVMWSVLVILAVIIAVGFSRLGSFRRLDFEKQDLLLVTEFDNLTGDEVFDGTIRQALSYDLGQSPYVSLFTGRRLSDALGRMEKRPGSLITADLGRELAQREGIAAVLEGSITRLDSSYLIGARLVDPVTGETVSTKSAKAEKRDDVFKAIDTLARNIRKDLGESLLSIERRDKPLARVTTSSLQALRYYTQGERHLGQADWEKAATFYQEAVAADSTFAIAYSKLGRIYFITARTNDALEFSAKAMDNRKSLSDREKYYIEAEYFRYRADYDKAIEKFILLLGEHEDDFDVRMNLATTYMLSSQHEGALAELQLAAELAPENWYIDFALGNAFGGLARYEEAVAQFSRVLRSQPRQDRTLDNLSWIHVCRMDLDGAQALQDSLAAGSDRPSVSLDYRQAKFLYYLGRNDEALDHLQKALGEVRRVGNRSQESWILIYRGLTHLAAGRLEMAQADFSRVVETWPGAVPLYYLGRTRVLMDDLSGAEEILATLENPANGELTHDHRGNAHHLRGLVLLYRGLYREAAAEIELSLKTLPAPHPRLALARAYLGAGKFSQARKALDPLVEYPFAAYLQNGGGTWPRALALMGLIAETEGKKSEAVRYYEKALGIWAGADRDHQEMMETRARLADLILEG